MNTGIKKYYLIDYLTDVKEGFDTIEDAVYAYMASKNEGGEPIITEAFNALVEAL